MFTGTLQLCTRSARLSIRRLTDEANKIALPFEEGSDPSINCAKYGSDRTLFAIWASVMFFVVDLGVFQLAQQCCSVQPCQQTVDLESFSSD